MMTSDIAANLTGERMLTKHTGGPEPPSRDEIARLAYTLYEAGARRDGHDVDDWLSAEQYLTRRYRLLNRFYTEGHQS